MMLQESHVGALYIYTTKFQNSAPNGADCYRVYHSGIDTQITSNTTCNQAMMKRFLSHHRWIATRRNIINTSLLYVINTSFWAVRRIWQCVIESSRFGCVKDSSRASRCEEVWCALKFGKRARNWCMAKASNYTRAR